MGHEREMRNLTIFWLGNLIGKYNSEDLDLDGNIILECILGK